LRVPNLDGCIIAAAGNLLSIGAPRNWFDPEIVRSQDTNKQKQGGKNLKKLTKSSAPSPGTRKRTFGNLLHLCHFKRVFINKKLPIRVVYLTGTQKRNMFFCYCSSILIKKLTVASGRSASTGNLQIASPESWWCRPYCRWQFAFHRDSTPQNRHCICEKSVDESIEAEREKLEKTYQFECPVTVVWQSPDCESQILMVSWTLPLAICFPSGLHATEETLKLREVRKRINRYIEKKTGKNLLARVPGQRRLAFKSASRAHQPDFHRLVIAAAGQLAILAPCNRHHTVIVRSQHTNQQKQRDKKTGKKNVQKRVPGQRRLAISRLRVPNLDGVVTAAAGNLLSIGAPRHRLDPDIVRSQDTNQQNHGGKNLRGKDLKEKNVRF